MSSSNGWIGVDLDGTLAVYTPSHFPAIGPPIYSVVRRVNALLDAGQEVRIFTARVAIAPEAVNDEGQNASAEFAADQHRRIDRWCEQVFGRTLPVTATKDFQMIELWDDRCRQVIINTGTFVEDLVPAEELTARQR